MHPKAINRRPLLWGLVLAAGLVATAVSHGQEPTIPLGQAKVDKSGAMIVPLGGSVEFDPQTDKLITDIINRNEDVLQVRPAKDPKKLLLSGRAPGLSQLTITFSDMSKRIFDVVVQPDYDLLRSVIKRTVPTASVDVIPGVGNVIILSGYVTRPEDADVIVRIASSAVGGEIRNVINALQVGGVQQVQIDVVIASVDRQKLRSRGFDFFVNGKSFQFNSIIAGLIGTQALGTGGPVSITPSPETNLAFAVIPTQFFGALRALETENLAKFLAEPRVTTQTGRPAFFRSGGQQATLGPASGINGPGVQLVPFGTELEVLPIVYGNNKIWLEVNPRISAVNTALGITTSFGTSPGFTEQNVRSAVMLESGQTFAIGGLIQNSVQASASRIPVLGQIPYVGAAFSRVTHQETENELIVMVTPRLVEALDCSQVPKRLPGRETRSPDDYELFLEGILEAPRGQRKPWSGHCYNAAYKCDPTYGTYPCIGNVCGAGAGTGVAGGVGCANGTCGVPAIGTPAASPAPLPATAAPVTPITPAKGVTVYKATKVEVAPSELPATVPGLPPAEQMPATLPPDAPVVPGYAR